MQSEEEKKVQQDSVLGPLLYLAHVSDFITLPVKGFKILLKTHYYIKNYTKLTCKRQ